MKRLTKVISLGIVISLLVAFFAIPAAASTVSRQATLLYNNIKVTLDGKEIIPKDANGNVVEPFVIDGTTYLPVRGVAGALNLGVGWDDKTSTVVLTSQTAVSIVDAALFDEDNGIKLAISLRNNLDVDITKVSVSIYGYDKDKKAIMNGQSNVLKVQKAENSEPGALYQTKWNLIPELPGVAYVEFAVTSYTTRDGTVVNIPFDQQIKNNVSK